MPDRPPLLLVSRSPLPPSARESIRAAYEFAVEHPDLPLIIERLKVYQLVAGRWEPLDPADPASGPLDRTRCEVTGKPMFLTPSYLGTESR